MRNNTNNNESDYAIASLPGISAERSQELYDMINPRSEPRRLPRLSRRRGAICLSCNNNNNNNNNSGTMMKKVVKVAEDTDASSSCESLSSSPSVSSDDDENIITTYNNINESFDSSDTLNSRRRGNRLSQRRGAICLSVAPPLLMGLDDHSNEEGHLPPLISPKFLNNCKRWSRRRNAVCHAVQQQTTLLNDYSSNGNVFIGGEASGTVTPSLYENEEQMTNYEDDKRLMNELEGAYLLCDSPVASSLSSSSLTSSTDTTNHINKQKMKRYSNPILTNNNSNNNNNNNNNTTTTTRRANVLLGDAHTQSLPNMIEKSKQMKPKIVFNIGNINSSPSFIEDMTSLRFDQFVYDEIELIDMIINQFVRLDLLNELQIKKGDMKEFIICVREKYCHSTLHNDLPIHIQKQFKSKNPYHNFRHAIDVFQMVLHLITKSAVLSENILTKAEVFALLLAALVHDIDHPGLTNDFHTRRLSEVAIVYNDESVLENHHASIFTRLLMKVRLLDHLDIKEFRDIRSLILKLLLNTDMSRHGTLLNELKHCVNDTIGEYSLNNELKDQHLREQFLGLILHCADLSNVIRPHPLCLRWTELLRHEFKLQGEIEVQLHMSTSNITKPQHTIDNITFLEKVSLPFMKFIGLPTFNVLAKVLPKCNHLVKRVEENIQLCEQLIKPMKSNYRATI